MAVTTDAPFIEFDFLCWISSNNIFFFKYNRNYALESHLLSYDSTCEKQLIIIYSFEDLEKNMIWWVVFSLTYIVKFGSRKIFGDNKFLISIVFKKWSNRNNLNTTRWLKSVFKVLRVFMNLKLIPPPPCYLSITHQLCSFVYYETTSNDRRFRSSRYCMLRANILKKNAIVWYRRKLPFLIYSIAKTKTMKKYRRKL